MAEYIKQKIQGGEKSICDSCTHRNVCTAINNQPCIECNHYQCTADVEPVQEWISVDDRLPEDDSDVLAYSSIGEESRIYPACYSNGVWFDCVFNAPATDTTTHWMKMPQPPKGE